MRGEIIRKKVRSERTTTQRLLPYIYISLSHFGKILYFIAKLIYRYPRFSKETCIATCLSCVLHLETTKHESLTSSSRLNLVLSAPPSFLYFFVFLFLIFYSLLLLLLSSFVIFCKLMSLQTLEHHYCTRYATTTPASPVNFRKYPSNLQIAQNIKTKTLQT